MAKLFKTSIFLLLAAFLLITEANHHNSDDESEGAAGKPNLKLKGLVPKLRSGGTNGSGGNSGGNSGSNSGSKSDSKSDSKSGSGSEGCKCNDAKFREFIKKFGILYHTYASKELAPELKSVFGKLTDFTMNYLAKEKPNEINKVHNFLQHSATATGGAIAQGGGH